MIIRSQFKAALLCLAVLAGLVLATPTSALAGGGYPPGMDYNGGGYGNETNPPSDDSPPPPPNGGGEANPPGTVWQTTSYTFDYSTGDQVICETLSDGRRAKGYTTLYLVYADGVGPDGDRYYRNASGNLVGGSTCNYEPASVVDTYSITCPVRVMGAITGPSGPGAGPSRLIASVNKISQWAATNPRPTTCGNESLYGAIGAQVLAQGIYRLDFTYRTQTCRVRSYSGTQPSEILSCGSEVAYPMDKAITVHCALPGGWQPSRMTFYRGVNLNFADENFDGCRNTNDFSWSCPTADLVAFSGVPYRGAAVKILDEGTPRLARYAPIRPTGVRNIHDLRTSWTVSGTPWRDNKLPNSGLQPVTVGVRPKQSDDLGTRQEVGGQVRDVWIGWQESGLSGEPSTLETRVWLSGEFKVSAVSLTRIDYLTGEVTITQTSVFRPGRASCLREPLQVDVTRARTSN